MTTTNSNTQTRFLATNDQITSGTGLAPFWNSQTTYWTSDAVRDNSVLEYTYPEFVGTTAAQVKTKVQQLYGFGGGVTKRDASAEITAKPFLGRRSRSRKYCSNGLTPNITQDIANLMGRTHYDWSVRVRFVAAELGRSFAVHCFLGTPPTNAADYMQASTYVGSAFAFNRMKNGDAVSQSFVQISKALVKVAKLVSLDPAVITPYLESELQWRITEVRAWLFTTCIKLICSNLGGFDYPDRCWFFTITGSSSYGCGSNPGVNVAWIGTSPKAFLIPKCYEYQARRVASSASSPLAPVATSETNILNLSFHGDILIALSYSYGLSGYVGFATSCTIGH